MSVISAPELLRTPRGYPPEWQRVFEALTAPINLVREISSTASSNGFADISAGMKKNEPRLSTDEILRFRKQANAVRQHLDEVLSEIEGVAEKTWRAGREIRTITDLTLYSLSDNGFDILDRMNHPGWRSAEYARIITSVIEQSRQLLPIPLLEALRDAIAAEKAIPLAATPLKRKRRKRRRKPPIAPTTSNKGGRPRDEKTAKILEFCYRKYVTEDKGAATVMRLCNTHFRKTIIKDDAQVRRYAKRHAERHGLPRKGQNT